MSFQCVEIEDYSLEEMKKIYFSFQVCQNSMIFI